MEKPTQQIFPSKLPDRIKRYNEFNETRQAIVNTAESAQYPSKSIEYDSNKYESLKQNRNFESEKWCAGSNWNNNIIKIQSINNK